MTNLEEIRQYDRLRKRRKFATKSLSSTKGGVLGIAASLSAGRGRFKSTSCGREEHWRCYSLKCMCKCHAGQPPETA